MKKLMIMKAEQYIKDAALPVAKQEDDVLSVSVSSAINGVSMARSEEKRKAITLHMNLCPKYKCIFYNKKDYSNVCACPYMRKFVELINK